MTVFPGILQTTGKVPAYKRAFGTGFFFDVDSGKHCVCADTMGSVRVGKVTGHINLVGFYVT